MQDFGAVGVPGGGGAVGVQDQGPAPAVDHDLVVIAAEQDAVFEAGVAAVGFVLDVVDLARGGGLVAAARPAAALIAQDDRVADAGRDGAGVADVQWQARAGQPGAQLPGPQEAGQAARAGEQVGGLADDRLPDRLPRHARQRGQAGRAGAAGGGRVGVGVAAGAVAGQLQAQSDQVIEDGGVDVAGDDRGDRGVAGDRAGGVAVQPRAAVAAGAAGG